MQIVQIQLLHVTRIFIVASFSDVLPTTSFQGVLKELLTEKDSVGWETSWVVRYSVVVKSRGIIKGKGYIVKGKRDIHKKQ